MQRLRRSKQLSRNRYVNHSDPEICCCIVPYFTVKRLYYIQAPSNVIDLSGASTASVSSTASSAATNKAIAPTATAGTASLTASASKIVAATTAVAAVPAVLSGSQLIPKVGIDTPTSTTPVKKSLSVNKPYSNTASTTKASININSTSSNSSSATEAKTPNTKTEAKTPTTKGEKKEKVVVPKSTIKYTSKGNIHKVILVYNFVCCCSEYVSFIEQNTCDFLWNNFENSIDSIDTICVCS